MAPSPGHHRKTPEEWMRLLASWLRGEPVTDPSYLTRRSPSSELARGGEAMIAGRSRGGLVRFRGASLSLVSWSSSFSSSLISSI